MLGRGGNDWLHCNQRDETATQGEARRLGVCVLSLVTRVGATAVNSQSVANCMPCPSFDGQQPDVSRTRAK